MEHNIKFNITIYLCPENESAPLDSNDAASYVVTNRKATVFNDAISVGPVATSTPIISLSRLALLWMRQKRAREITHTDPRSESTDRNWRPALLVASSHIKVEVEEWEKSLKKCD